MNGYHDDYLRAKGFVEKREGSGGPAWVDGPLMIRRSLALLDKSLQED
jgi:hypothetical protein